MDRRVERDGIDGGLDDAGVRGRLGARGGRPTAAFEIETDDAIEVAEELP